MSPRPNIMGGMQQPSDRVPSGMQYREYCIYELVCVLWYNIVLMV